MPKTIWTGRILCGALATLAGTFSASCSLLGMDELDNGGTQMADGADDGLGPLPAGDVEGGEQDAMLDAAVNPLTWRDAALDGAATSNDDALAAPEGSIEAGHPDSAAQDASTGSPDDASASVDAKAEAASTPDAAGTRPWCATHTSASTFDCHDFDEGQQAQSGFTSHYYSGLYSTVTSTDFAPGSAPSSLLVSTPSLAAGASPQDEQFNDLVPFHNKLDLRFALRVVNYDMGAPDVSLFRVSYQDGTWGTSLDFQHGGAQFVTQTAQRGGGIVRSTSPASQPSTLDAWTNVDCSIDFKSHTLSLSYDGVVVINNQTLDNPSGTTPPIFVQIGLNFLGAPAQPMKIYYDDVLLDTPP